MNDFREKALADRREEIMAFFPESVVDGLQSSWHASAMNVYRNWLQYMAAHRVESSAFAPDMVSHDRLEQKPSAAP
jgi:hypothetical protein